VVKNVELPGGRTLREQKRPPRIEQDTNGFKELRRTLKGLERQGNHGRIYQLLRQLRDWEIRPRSLGGPVPAFMRDSEGAGAAQDHGVAEVIDLSELNDDDVVDVDAFILEVLLVGVTKVQYSTCETRTGGTLCIVALCIRCSTGTSKARLTVFHPTHPLLCAPTGMHSQIKPDPDAAEGTRLVNIREPAPFVMQVKYEDEDEDVFLNDGRGGVQDPPAI